VKDAAATGTQIDHQGKGLYGGSATRPFIALGVFGQNVLYERSTRELHNYCGSDLAAAALRGRPRREAIKIK
jgi:hypothetical protein